MSIRIASASMGEVYLPGQSGGMVKPRPVVVVGDQITYEHGDLVRVAIVTTTNDDPDGVYVDIPWSNDPNCRASTQLQRQSWAAAHWVIDVPTSELDTNKFGSLPPKSFWKLLTAIESCK